MSCDSSGGTTDGPRASRGPREGDECKAARREGDGGGGGDHVVSREARSGVEVDGADGDGDGGAWRGVLGLLLGLEPEGVFRAVLSFL